MLLQDETCEESGEDMMARQLGLEMVYHLFTLQHVDQLLEYHKKGGRAALHCTTPHFTTLLCTVLCFTTWLHYTT